MTTISSSGANLPLFVPNSPSGDAVDAVSGAVGAGASAATTPSAPVYDNLVGANQALVAQGLGAPMDPSDVEALLGEIGSELDSTLAETRANGELNAESSQNALLKKKTDLLAQLEQAFQVIDAAQQRGASDSSQVAANNDQISSDSDNLFADAAIASFIGQQITFLQNSGSGDQSDAAAIAQLTSSLGSLTGDEESLRSDINALTTQNGALGTDSQAQGAVISSATTQAAGFSEQLLQVSSAIAAQTAQNGSQSGAGGQDTLQSLLSRVISEPTERLAQDVKTKQANETVDKQISAAQTAAALAQTVVAALAALASIAGAGQQGPGSSQVQLVA